MSESMMSAAEAARQVGVTPRVMTTHCSRGKVPGAVKVGTPRGDVWMVPASTVEHYREFIGPRRG